MSYAELDCIADLYNPFLLLCCFVLLAKRFYSNRSVKSLALQVMALGLYLLGVYALMALDQRFYIWPALGWDYRTHSAFAGACPTSTLPTRPRDPTPQELWKGTPKGSTIRW